MALLAAVWLMVPWFLYIQYQRDPFIFQVMWHTLSSLAAHPLEKAQEAFTFWGIEGTVLWFYPSVMMIAIGLAHWWREKR